MNLNIFNKQVTGDALIASSFSMLKMQTRL